MSTMTEIEQLTQKYSEARQRLTGLVQALQTHIECVRAQYMNEIRAAVRGTGDAHAKLHEALSNAPELFQRPKTRTIAGVKIGYGKRRGKVVMEDEAAVIARIRKLLPEEQAELLIRVSESVHKPAVYDLTAADLKRLGITVTDDEDAVVIKPVDGEIDKLVNALLAEAEKVEDTL